MPLDDNDRKEIAGLIDVGVKKAVEPLTTTIGQLNAANDQLGGKLTTIEKSIADIGEQLKAPKAKGDDPKTEADGPPAWFTDAMKPVQESVEQLRGERDQERAARESAARVDAWVKEKRPGLVKHSAVIARVKSAQPKDDEAVARLVDAELKYLEQTGVDVKKLTADPAQEGGSKGEEEGSSEKAVEGIRALRKKS